MTTAANTVSSHFMSVPTTTAACESDLNQIKKHCKPTPEKRDDKPQRGGYKPKPKGGLTGKLANAMKEADDKAKSLVGYDRTKTAGQPNNDPVEGNAWMEEHCTGLWIKPHSSNLENINETIGTYKENLSTLKEQVTELNSAGGIVKQMLSLLYDVSPMTAAAEAAKLGLKTGTKTIVGGAAGTTGIGLVVTAGMVSWTLYDIVTAIDKLSGLLGERGAALKGAFDQIKNLPEAVENLQKELVNEPLKGLTNSMETMATLNPCVSARKCLLVPYKNAKNSRDMAKTGSGCCPGQTGHHIMPNAMFKDKNNKSVCPGYDYNEAPVICLEGTKNAAGWGSHGKAHSNLETNMKFYRDKRQSNGLNTDLISYKDGSKLGIEAVREAAAKHCDPKCLQAQLDHHYNQCKDLEAETTDDNDVELEPNDGKGRLKKINDISVKTKKKSST